ncbi:MAG: hypothetical protein ACW99J_17995 [Candidatus Thorarchaeota archaeon]
MDMTVHAEMKWNVIGQTDIRRTVLECRYAYFGSSGKYLGVGNDMIAVGNATREEASEVEVIFLGPSEYSWAGTDKVAVKLVDGPYLSWENHTQLAFSGTEIGTYTTFYYAPANDGYRLRAGSVWRNSIVRGMGEITTHATEYTTFVEEVYYESEPRRLVQYDESFRFSGITVEEYTGAIAGVFYSNNVTEIGAAAMVFTHDYSYNSTTTVHDMPAVLNWYGVNVSSTISDMTDRYSASIVLNELFIPAALATLPPNKNLPLIIAIEGYSRISDLSEALTGTYILQDSCTISTADESLTTTKLFDLNWYNTSSKIGLTPWGIVVEIDSWGWTDTEETNLIGLMIGWNAGITTVTWADDNPIDFGVPDDSRFNRVQNMLEIGFSVVDLHELAFKLLPGFEHLSSPTFQSVLAKSKGLPRIWVKLKFSWHNSMSNIAKAINSAKSSRLGAKFLKCFKHFGKVATVLGIAVDIGLSIWAGVAIAESIGGEAGKTIGTTYALVSAFIGVYVIAAISIALATFGPLGWILLLAFLISDLTTGWTGDLAEYATRAFYGDPVLAFITEPYSVIQDGPFEEFSDSNGLNVGDTITISLEVRAAVRGVDPPNDLYDINEEVFLRYSWNKPYLNLIVPTTIDPYFEEGFGPEPGDLPWTAEWAHNGEYWGDGAYWREVDKVYNISASVSPLVAMNNYPVMVKIGDSYRVWQVTVRYPLWRRIFKKGPLVEEAAIDEATGEHSVTTLYYDVFPDDLDDFLTAYAPLSQTDVDADGLNSTLESLYGTSQWDYDSDGDQLNDKYEIDMGLDPTSSDTDGDGVSDWYEYVYSTNATDKHSDNDVLSDYKEISGWTIKFYYLNNQSLPFQIHVTSDPLTNDTDSDGIDDFTEYRCGTNPRSNDTDGDGNADPIVEKITSHSTFEKSIEWSIHIESSVYDLAVDSDGNLYLAQDFGSEEIMGFDSDLTPTTNISVPPTILASSVEEIAYDENSSTLYVCQRYFDSGDATTKWNITQFDTNGTQLETQWIQDPWWIYGLDTDSDGNVYLARAYSEGIGPSGYHHQIDFCSSDAGVFTLIDTLGSYGTNPDQFDDLWYAGALAVDEDRGFLYVCEPDRVAIWDLSDSSYVGDLSYTFQNIAGIDVDNDGYVYVADEGNRSVRKFNRAGVEDTEFKITAFANTQFEEITDLIVDSDRNIYVLDRNDTGGSKDEARILKFSQVVRPASDFIPETIPDWDGDGLTNVQEIDGWEISVNFTYGEMTFNVASNPLVNDTDHDGLDDMLEFTLGSHPNSTDTDLDGVSDFEEWWLTYHPGEIYVPPVQSSFIAPSSLYSNHMGWAPAGPSLTDWDTDGDLLGDSTELTFGSSPVNPDSDAEGLSDLMEFLLDSNPNAADSDGDGADDLYEYTSNSSLLDADSDNDLALDGVEYAIGTDTAVGDNDQDGLADGYEIFTGLNPLNEDSDGDGVADAIEISLYMDPLNNDTDSDGILDGLEIEYGSNPLNNDTDWDGVPDGLDSDTISTWSGPVVLVYGDEPANGTLEFQQALSEHVNVINVTVNDLLDDYTAYQYIVIVGQPDADDYGVGGLSYDILEDTGDVVDGMMVLNSHEAAVRHGYWTDPQTVVIMSSAYESDLYPVLQMLRGWNITILSDLAVIEYNAYAILDNVTVAYAAFVNEIDTVKATDAIVSITLSGLARPELTIRRYNESTTPHQLTYATGLAEEEVSLGKYLDVDLVLHDTTLNVFDNALIQIYYKVSDLDLTGDGQLGDMGDINETSLSLYFYDTTDGEWIKLSEDLDWVISLGQNTTNVELYGEQYAGYVWVQITQLSLFAVAGQTIGVPVEPPNYLLIALIFGGVGFLGVVVAYRRRKGRVPGRKVRMDIVDQLLDSS